MIDFLKYDFFGVVLMLTWLIGIVVADGAWSTAIAVLFPWWAWYLAVEMLLLHFGMI